MSVIKKQKGHIAGIASLVAHRVNLPLSTAELQVTYKSALPFPHLVLDNLFPTDTLDKMLAELPPTTDDRWVRNHSVESNLRSAIDLGPVGFQFAAFLNSASFLYLLSEMTDIWGLLPDPYLGGAGYHVAPKGGTFDVRLEPSVDGLTGLKRRLVMLTYLNHSWPPDFGAQLELWSHDAGRCEKSIEPVFNRTVLMEVGETNFHGIRPVRVEGRSTMSFATYYHTVGEKELKADSSIYAPSFYQKKEPLGRRLAKDIIPPFLVRAVKSMKGPK